MKRNLRFITVQPATMYYTWQVEVWLNNLLKYDVQPENIHIICGIDKHGVPKDWMTLSSHYEDVGFFFYTDTRLKKHYIPSIQPHLLKKHLVNYPSIKDEAVFLCDNDMVFTRKPNLQPFVNDDIWYMSNTEFYIGANYIKSKGREVYEKMCDIVGIDEVIPERNQNKSGGAQYILKNLTYDYLEKVEYDSVKLYDYFIQDLRVRPKTDDYEPIQKWTAGMWAFLWNAWYFGHETETPKELDFAWATDRVEAWQERMIYHNAGVMEDQRDRLFYKGDYIDKRPYGIDNTYSEDFASHKYVKEIIETARESPLYEHSMPNKVDMAKNLVKDVKKSVKKAVKRERVLNEELGKQRFEICKACPHLTKENRCEKCGCHMPTKSKLEASSCPIGKW